MRFLLSAALAAAIGSAAQAGCLGDTDPCETSMGSYHIVLPEGTAGPVPALMFLHGAGGSGESSVRPGGIARVALDRGYAVIGPNGMDRPGRFGTGWSFHPERPKQRDELAFLAGIRDDAAKRFGIDPTRVILAGFSIGGSMTSYIACEDPNAFAAFAPVAGSFWRPHPEDCTGAVKLLHTHGWRDRTVPLEGRPLGGGRIYQGDVWHAMLLWRAENTCDGMRADTFDTEGRFWIRRWEECAPGTALEFALHPGGHGIPQGWTALTLDWFEGLSETTSN